MMVPHRAPMRCSARTCSGDFTTAFGGRLAPKSYTPCDVGEFGQVVLRLLHARPHEQPHGNGKHDHEQSCERIVYHQAERHKAVVFRREPNKEDHVQQDKPHARRHQKGEASAGALQRAFVVARFDGGVAALELVMGKASRHECGCAYCHERQEQDRLQVVGKPQRLRDAGGAHAQKGRT